VAIASPVSGTRSAGPYPATPCVRGGLAINRFMTGCTCINIDFGTYERTVGMRCPLIERNDGWVCIDICIARAIAEMWALGIKTLNSCCGHGKLKPTVIVAPEAVRMAWMHGYRMVPATAKENPQGLTNCFYLDI
jgi:hypothetical protein